MAAMSAHVQAARSVPPQRIDRILVLTRAEMDGLSAYTLNAYRINRHSYSAGRMWIVPPALLPRFRACLRGFGLVRA
jgi:hypothetical protein